MCDTAGVSFSYRQDVSSTVIRFEHRGAQATVAEDGADAEPKTPAVADADAACEGAHRVAWPEDLAAPGVPYLPGYSKREA